MKTNKQVLNDLYDLLDNFKTMKPDAYNSCEREVAYIRDALNCSMRQISNQLPRFPRDTSFFADLIDTFESQLASIERLGHGLENASAYRSSYQHSRIREYNHAKELAAVLCQMLILIHHCQPALRKKIIPVLNDSVISLSLQNFLH